MANNKLFESLKKMVKPIKPQATTKTVGGVESSNEPDLPQPFGYKSAWIAIKNAPSANDVAANLGLTDVISSNWSSGLAATYEPSGKVFVSPSLDDWTLVVGTSLPNPGDDRYPNTIRGTLEKLSREYTEVCYFCSNRITEYHCWARANGGRIARAYCFCGETGETLWVEGAKTQDEIDLGFNFYSDGADPGDAEDAVFPCEEDVLAIAKRWGIDPSFESGGYPPSIGLLGRLR